VHRLQSAHALLPACRLSTVRARTSLCRMCIMHACPSDFCRTCPFAHSPASCATPPRTATAHCTRYDLDCLAADMRVPVLTARLTVRQMSCAVLLRLLRSAAARRACSSRPCITSHHCALCLTRRVRGPSLPADAPRAISGSWAARASPGLVAGRSCSADSAEVSISSPGAIVLGAPAELSWRRGKSAADAGKTGTGGSLRAE